ncbi:MAG TPA: Calx-beta domain-containing protein [Thermoanaerobaculia bacterium]|nr:Calx-beta domain-containing protein [Thermoanaerobaculia bacterium]
MAPNGGGFTAIQGSQGRRYDGAGRPVGLPFSIGTAEHPGRCAMMAADRGGNFVVVWSGEDEIFAQRFAADGRPRALPFPMPRPTGSADRRRSVPRVTRALSGEFVVTWQEYQAVGSSSIHQLLLQRFDREGNALGAPRRGDAGYLFDSPPVALTNDGGFVLLWLGWPTQDQSRPIVLRYRFFDREGRPGGIHALSLDPDSTTPALAADGRGGFAAAWRGSNGRLLLRGFDARGPLGPPLAFRETRPIEGVPFALGSSEHGDVLFARARYSPESEDVALGLEGQRFVNGGSAGALRLAGSRAASEKSGALQLRVERRDGNLGAVSATLTVTGRTAAVGDDFLLPQATVSFADGESAARTVTLPLVDDALAEGDETLRIALRDPTGGAVLTAPAQLELEIRDDDAPPVQLGNLLHISGEAEEQGLGYHAEPQLAGLTGGGFVVACESRQDNDYPAGFLAAYSPDGGEYDSSVGSRASALTPVAEAGGGFSATYMAWTHGDGEEFPEPLGPKVREWSATGVALGPPRDLPWLPVTLARGWEGSRIALRPVETGYFEVEVRLQRFGAEWQKLGREISLPSSHARRGDVALAAAPSGAFVVVALGLPSTSAAGLYAYLYDRRGTLRAGPLRIDGGELFAGRPAVAMRPDGGFVVAWRGIRDEEFTSVFVRLFDRKGIPRTAPLLAGGSLVAGDQGAPSVAVQADGRFLVAWQSGPRLHDGPATVLAQAYAENGERTGDALSVDSDREVPQITPHAAVAEAGRFVVVWRRLKTTGENRRDSIRARLLDLPPL